ncbi:MAG: LysM peptidoglycan-binding domain-containing protein, partial [Terriglobus roseus]|nr:LysM peptidoglycan-binding domain-containing protein [Terriglobus roseus]
CLAQAGASGAAGYYRAARIYNSGSITNDDLSSGVATHCYSSDIANRLTGWLHGTHGCNLDGASVAVNTVMPHGGGSAPAPSSAPPVVSVPAPAPTSESTPTTTAAPVVPTPVTPPTEPTSVTLPTVSVPAPPPTKPTQSPEPPKAKPSAHHSAPSVPMASPPSLPPLEGLPTGDKPSDSGPLAAQVSQAPAAPAAQAAPAPAAPSDSSSVGEKAPGVTESCSKYYTVQEGDSCWTLGQKYSFSFAQFQSWNTQIDGGCSNLWKGYQYCVEK